VGFGTEILFMLMLGLLVLGPKRLHAMLGHVTRAKAELENALPQRLNPSHYLFPF
jgi:Sec-independent protein translocase protein TatA